MKPESLVFLHYNTQKEEINMSDPFVQKMISIATVLLGALVTIFGSAFLFFGSESDLIVLGVLAVVLGSTLMQRMLLINPIFSFLFWGFFSFSI